MMPAIAALGGVRLSCMDLIDFGIATRSLKICLPDSLAKEAKAAGFLAPEAIERMAREAIRRRALEKLKEAMDRMAEVEGPVMMPEEIQQEIRSARADRRAREARAAGA